MRASQQVAEPPAEPLGPSVAIVAAASSEVTAPSWSASA